MFAKIIALATLVVATTSYPLFKQCDARWSADQLGTSAKTVCQAGCLISSVSMILNDCGRAVNGAAATPKSLNVWLRNNGGYASGNLFVWGSVAPLGLGYVGKFTADATIRNYFN